MGFHSLVCASFPCPCKGGIALPLVDVELDVAPFGEGCRGCGGVSHDSHAFNVSATAPSGFAMTAPDSAGQRLLWTISVLSISISAYTSNSYSTSPRCTGAMPILRGDVLPFTTSTTYSVLERIVAMICNLERIMVSMRRFCKGVASPQALKLFLLLERLVIFSTTSSSPPMPLHACERLSITSTAYPAASAS